MKNSVGQAFQPVRPPGKAVPHQAIAFFNRLVRYNRQRNDGTSADGHSQLRCLGRKIAGSIAMHAESTVKFIVNLDRDETGMIVAECPAIPGCISQGKTEAEALANIREAIEVCLEARAANGMPLTVATREVEVKV